MTIDFSARSAAVYAAIARHGGAHTDAGWLAAVSELEAAGWRPARASWNADLAWEAEWSSADHAAHEEATRHGAAVQRWLHRGLGLSVETAADL